MKNILQVLSGNHMFSGVTNYLYQQYLHIDRDKVRYDFFFCKENSMELVMNEPVFHDSRFYIENARFKRSGSTDYLRIMRALDRVLTETHYDAVVVNTSIIMIIQICLMVVKRHPGVRLIAHAHNSGLVLNRGALRQKIMPLMNAAENAMKSGIRRDACALFACSEAAGRTTFGAEAVGLEKFRVVKNAIDTEKFRYHREEARRLRNELGAGDETLVIGNVGRLARIKNQAFLIDVFAAVHQKRPDSRLWLIGDGPDREKLSELVAQKGLRSQVLFLGEKKDVNRYYPAMDAFAFTSISEGLGIVAIEAQAAGLPTIISEGVPDDVLLTPLCVKMPLADGAERWAEAIIGGRDRFDDHPDFSEQIREAGYDIGTETAKMAEFYSNLD